MNIIANIRYAWYVLKHKWYVMLECRRLHVSWSQALKHDLSKLSKAEWGPYRDHFYVAKDKSARDPRFTEAWLHHLINNPHHWQYWVEPNRVALEMPEWYMLEMIADWRGMSRTLKQNDDAVNWYLDNYDKISLHPNTRAQVDAEILGRWPGFMR